MSKLLFIHSLLIIVFIFLMSWNIILSYCTLKILCDKYTLLFFPCQCWIRCTYPVKANIFLRKNIAYFFIEVGWKNRQVKSYSKHKHIKYIGLTGFDYTFVIFFFLFFFFTTRDAYLQHEEIVSGQRATNRLGNSHSIDTKTNTRQYSSVNMCDRMNTKQGYAAEKYYCIICAQQTFLWSVNVSGVTALKGSRQQKE